MKLSNFSFQLPVLLAGSSGIITTTNAEAGDASVLETVLHQVPWFFRWTHLAAQVASHTRQNITY